MGRSLQQVAELPQCSRTYDIPFIYRDEFCTIILRDGDIEMVEPEVGHDLPKLVLRIGGPEDLLAIQLTEQFLLRLIAFLFHVISQCLPVSFLIRLHGILIDDAIPDRHANYLSVPGKSFGYLYIAQFKG